MSIQFIGLRGGYGVRQSTVVDEPRKSPTFYYTTLLAICQYFFNKKNNQNPQLDFGYFAQIKFLT